MTNIDPDKLLTAFGAFILAICVATFVICALAAWSRDR